MEAIDFADGEYIVELGDEADCLFLVLSGEVVCHREGADGGGEGKELLRLGPGEIFGESALGDSDTPHQRLANVVAVGATRVGCLKVVDFSACLGSLTETISRNFNRKVMGGVSLLDPLTEVEKDGVLEALQEVSFDEGVNVITQGSVGTNFYIIKSGSVQVGSVRDRLRPLTSYLSPCNDHLVPTS